MTHKTAALRIQGLIGGMVIAVPGVMYRSLTALIKCLSAPLLLFILFACSGSSNDKDEDYLSTTPDTPSENNTDTTIPPESEPTVFEDPDFLSEVTLPDTINPDCPEWASGQTISIDQSITLPANCYFERITLQFTKPDIDFDCSNAVFNGLDSLDRLPFDSTYTEETKPHRMGFLISGSETAPSPVNNISIRNCQLINYVNSIFIHLPLSTATREALRSGNGDENSLRSLAPSNIRVTGSKLINSHHHGIFVHRYVTGFELDQSVIKGSGNSGLYLEAGSRDALIKNNVIEGNGYSTYSTTSGFRGPRKSLNSRREGIAIDGSQYNTIRNNRFISNADGGIYLYKNCWEDAENPTTIPRTEGANYNTISDNTFIDEEVGVWMAERADRNLAAFSCGDEILLQLDEELYYRDYASENRISDNFFNRSNTGIRVHDDNNTLVNNVFENTIDGPDIEIGSLLRNLVDNPVENVTLENNQTSKPDAIVYQ